MIPFTLTEAEANLLDDIQELEFGEIRLVEIHEGIPRIYYPLDPKQDALIKLIREGTTHFDVIKVYDKKPAYAEVPGITRKSKFRCIKTYKF